MTAGLASDWKVRDEYTDWHGNRSLVAKKVIAGIGGGGGGDWILASGSWDDAGVWDDDAMWKDAA